jgi:hypothetical protein
MVSGWAAWEVTLIAMEPKTDALVWAQPFGATLLETERGSKLSRYPSIPTIMIAAAAALALIGWLSMG